MEQGPEHQLDDRTRGDWRQILVIQYNERYNPTIRRLAYVATTATARAKMQCPVSKPVSASHIIRIGLDNRTVTTYGIGMVHHLSTT